MSQTPMFVTRDRELERGHEAATEELAEHRWHWTLDESNPERVSNNEYARLVGRSRSSIQRMAHGYAAWRGRQPGFPGGPVTLTDFIEQANLGAEKAEATEAVAKATGKSFTAAARSDRSEIREVLATAQDRAERKGTTVSEELPRVAESREKARQVRSRESTERKKNTALFMVEFEGHIAAAVRRLREALALARDVDFDEEQVEMLEGSIDTLRTLVRLIDVRITGETGVDWDAELAALTEKE